MSTRQTPPSSAGPGSGRKRPLYRVVSDELRRRMIEGVLSPGHRLPPLRELAREFGVSTITVLQALRTLEQEGRLHSISGVGMFVRPSGSGSTATGQMTVAFVTIEIESSFTTRLAHHLEESCQQRGWGMQLFNAQADPKIEARNLASLPRSGASGAIILPVGDADNAEVMASLKLKGFPLVLVDRFIPGLKVDVVESDHEKGAYMATEYLLNHGHRRILNVTLPSTLEPMVARNRGYEQALLDHGIEPRHHWTLSMDDEVTAKGSRERRRWLGAYEAALPALKTLDPPIAVFAYNAYSGWGVAEACRELGLRVPEDVSIVCFDDSEITRALSPPMTAIAQRSDEISRIAVELLDRRLASGQPEEPQRVLVDVDLVERGSVASVERV